MSYTAHYANGINVALTAKTLMGAKREASKIASYEAGSISLECDNGEIYKKSFWRNGNRFGWDNWTQVKIGE